ncbi:MAG: cation:proton antiporter [Anaerolineae bacterium]
MHQDLTLIATITMAVLLAFVGGYIARKLKLPSLVGYLLAGLAIGPFTPGFVGDSHAASQLAEMGVIFMMFGVGLHFSLKDLWSVRQIAIPGAVFQMVFATLLGLALTQLWGWSVSAGLVLGLAISIASTVVLLRGLSDNGMLSTPHGKVAVGWLVLEDLATVMILVLLPALVNNTGSPLESIGVALLKTALFVGIMLFVGARVMPWILARIVHTRSAELFILAVVALALGTAFAAYELFGVSLALGAFLAGVVVGESDVSHQVSAQVLPFRDLFAVLFFVSVGMLVNPTVIVANAGSVIALTILIVFGKALLTILLGLFLPASGRTVLIVAAGLSQIGEFSFIVGQAGVALGLLTQDQYGIILAGSVLSIILNPLMFRAVEPVERLLQRSPGLWHRLERGGPMPQPIQESMSNHVVVVGYGRVGKHIGQVLRQLGFPYLVVEQDAAYASDIQKQGIPTLFGDAANSEVLTHAGLERACALVSTIPQETTAELVVAAARDLAPTLPIVARAGTTPGVERLVALGADQVIHPELEGGVEIVRHMLLALKYPMTQILPYLEALRRDTYKGTLNGNVPAAALDQMLMAVRGVDLAWMAIEEGSPVIDRTLAEADIRSKVGASVVVLIRQQEVFPNPKSRTVFQQGDMLGLIGESQELEAAAHLLNPAAS